MKHGPYRMVIAPADYPGKIYSRGRAYEHRVNWWRHTGQNPDGLVVHHRDEVKHNNRPVNLEAMKLALHSQHHARPPTLLGYKCEICGKDFERPKRGKKVRRFCSIACTRLAPLGNRVRRYAHGTLACHRYCRCAASKAAKSAAYYASKTKKRQT